MREITKKTIFQTMEYGFELMGVHKLLGLTEVTLLE